MHCSLPTGPNEVELTVAVEDAASGNPLGGVTVLLLDSNNLSIRYQTGCLVQHQKTTEALQMNFLLY